MQTWQDGPGDVTGKPVMPKGYNAFYQLLGVVALDGENAAEDALQQIYKSLDRNLLLSQRPWAFLWWASLRLKAVPVHSGSLHPSTMLNLYEPLHYGYQRQDPFSSLTGMKRSRMAQYPYPLSS